MPYQLIPLSPPSPPWSFYITFLMEENNSKRGRQFGWPCLFTQKLPINWDLLWGN
jgi:hypothetical protein